MASKENQEALDNLYDYAEMGCSTWDSENDNESISKSKQVLQQAIDDIELYKKAIHIAVANSQVRKIKDKFMEENCLKETAHYCEGIGCVECIVKKSLEQAKEELENDRTTNN